MAAPTITGIASDTDIELDLLVLGLRFFHLRGLVRCKLDLRGTVGLHGLLSPVYRDLLLTDDLAPGLVAASGLSLVSAHW
jgi:hypothetical protein